MNRWRRINRDRELSAESWFPPRAPIGIFSHVPKTGGTTIHKWLKSNLKMWNYRSSTRLPRKPPPDQDYVLYLGHLPLKNAVEARLFSRKMVDQIPSFGFVRNPISRALSLYHQQLTSTEEKISDDLDDFAEQLWRNRGNLSWWTPSKRLMARPSTYWLKPRNAPHVKTVYRFEEFDFAVEHLRALYEIESHPQPRNVSRVSREKQAEPTSRFVEIVADLYREDFENFGYELPR